MWKIISIIFLVPVLVFGSAINVNKWEKIKNDLKQYEHSLLDSTKITSLEKCYNDKIEEDEDNFVLCSYYFDLIVQLNNTNLPSKEIILPSKDELEKNSYKINITILCNNITTTVSNAFKDIQICESKCIKVLVKEPNAAKTVKPICKILGWMSMLVKNEIMKSKTTKHATTNQITKTNEDNNKVQLQLQTNPQQVVKKTKSSSPAKIFDNVENKSSSSSSSPMVVNKTVQSAQNTPSKSISTQKVDEKKDSPTNPKEKSLTDSVNVDKNLNNLLTNDENINNVDMNSDEGDNYYNPPDLDIGEKSKVEIPSPLPDTKSVDDDDANIVVKHQQMPPVPKLHESSILDNDKFDQLKNDYESIRGDGKISQDDPFYEKSGSNFFTYLLVAMFCVILLYVAYHNKSKILALLLEGRRGQKGRGGSGRRKHTAAYRKLDSNLEEAISSQSSARSSQIIY